MQRLILFIAVVGFVGAVVFSVLSLPDRRNRPLPTQDRTAQAQKSGTQEAQPPKEQTGKSRPAPSPAPIAQARAEKPPAPPAPARQPSQAAPQTSPQAAPEPELTKLRQQIEELNREKKILAKRAMDLEMKLARTEENEKSAPGNQGQFRVKPEESVILTTSTLFKSGPVELSPSGEQVVAKVAEKFKERLQSAPQALIRVEGHSDDTALGTDKRNQYQDNMGLSLARALIVARQLVKEGINPRRISVAGFGEYQPVASNETAQGQAKNRRVVIMFIPQ